MIYKQLCTAEKFYPDQLLDILKITSEHEALELADKVEASLVTWRRKTGGLTHSKSSWDMMKDIGGDADRGNDKNHILAARARSLLFCLKQRYPELSQTSLDICKIQYNRVSSPNHFYIFFLIKIAMEKIDQNYMMNILVLFVLVRMWERQYWRAIQGF